MRRGSIQRLVAAVAVVAASAVVCVTVGSAAEAASPPVNTSLPTISGSAIRGQVLTATSGSWSGTTPISLAYQWQRCDASGGGCAAIAGASSQTYPVQSADVGRTLRAVVTATNVAGSGAALSPHTAVVVSGAAPVNTAAPHLTGTLKVGDSLHVSAGSWSGTAPITFSYEWQRCNAQGVNCVAFTSGAATSYRLAAADLGNRLQVRVTAKNSVGQASKYSNQTGPVGANAVAPANTAPPQLTGTLVEGQTLQVSAGSWTGTAPITLAAQWQRCNGQGVNCTPITGATGSSYMLSSADVGARLQVLVTATNAGGTTGKYSNQTAVVAASTGPVAASTVNLPDRLIIDRLQFPTGAHARTPFSARFHVSDTAHHPVSGALVYLLGLPYGWIQTAPEQATDASGWVSFTLNPTAKMPRSGALVMFVRARTPQGDPLAGASNRRLVQARIRP